MSGERVFSVNIDPDDDDTPPNPLVRQWPPKPEQPSRWVGGWPPPSA